MISSHHVFNVLQEQRPDVVETLSQPNWYFDRKGETSKGQKEWVRASVFYWYDGKLYTKYASLYFSVLAQYFITNTVVLKRWDPYYVRSLSRFSDKGLIPPLSDAQVEALKVLEETCLRLSLHMILEVGDIQFLSNNHVFHARTGYVDHPPPHPRRHLMRLWLSTPEVEGGWRLPFADSKQLKRGGIQVDDTIENAPLDAE